VVDDEPGRAVVRLGVFLVAAGMLIGLTLGLPFLALSR